MAVQPFAPWLSFQFLNRVQSRQDSLDGGAACRKATIYTLFISFVVYFRVNNKLNINLSQYYS
jgi:hypothetical protein